MSKHKELVERLLECIIIGGDEVYGMLEHKQPEHQPKTIKQAANAIETLEAEVEELKQGGCMRGNQRTTQYCAEAVDLQGQLAQVTKERDELKNEVARLKELPEIAQWLGDTLEETI